MHLFTVRSIGFKLILLIAAASGLALATSWVAFVASGAMMVRQSKVQQLTALADVVASNSTAALSFGKAEAARELLAGLRNQPTIEYACLFDSQGRLFAAYGPAVPSGLSVPAPGPMGHVFTRDGYLDIRLPVRDDDENLGSIYLHASMNDLHKQLAQQMKIAAVEIVLCLALALGLGGILQRRISAPILNLAETARRIYREGDYSIRVRQRSPDEIGVLYGHFNQMLDRIEEGERQLQRARDQLEVRVEERTRQLTRANQELRHHVAERERAAQQIQDMHQQLVDAARKAGMADVATNILHNVGNVLNSVNVSASLICDRLSRLAADDLARTAEIVQQHRDDLADYITRDERGKHLPRFLAELSRHMTVQEAAILEEAKSLTKNVDHIKNIISLQQAHATGCGLIEKVSPAQIVEDAIRINSASAEKHGIRFVRELDELPDMAVDKQKLLDVLVNLISNAKNAILQNDKLEQGTILVRLLKTENGRVRIDVKDNGIGIPAENMTRIFSHGFTTRKGGHGFGLHGAALAAQQMQGSLTARSDGPGTGAAFSLEIPFRPLDECRLGTAAR